MIIIPVSFNGHTLNTSDYEAKGLNMGVPPASKPVFLDNAGEDSNYSGAFTVDVRSIAIGIRIKNYGDRYELKEQLRGWFRRGTEGDLVATLSVDGLEYAMSCVVQNLVQDETFRDRFTVLLQTGQTDWVSVERDEDSWTATDANKTKTITVEGTEDVETQLNLILTPKVAPGTGYFYQDLLQLVGSTVDYGTRPWCKVMDTATLVTAGKLRSDCHDLRVFFGKDEVHRWITDPNTDHTKLWFNAPLGPSRSLVLLTALDDETDPGILEFAANADSKAAITAIPYQGIIYHGTEWIAYEGKNPNTCTLFTKQRGAFGTTMQAHSAAVTFKTIQTPIIVYYGNPAAADPSAGDANYDDTKPVFNLSSSTNAAWVYDATSLFSDPDHPNRPGEWTLYDNGQNGPNSFTYRIKEFQASGDPAMGMLLAPYVGANGQWWPLNSARYIWIFTSPGGISKISLSGQKKSNLDAWPSAAIAWSRGGQEYGYYGWDPQSATNISAPTSGDWGAWSVTDKSWYDWSYIAAIFGGQARGSGGYAAFEVLTGTITFVSSTLPTDSLLGEKDNFSLSIGIKNNENGDQMNILLPTMVDADIVLDSEEKTAVYQGINIHGCLQLNDEGRAVWIRLVPGSNELEITGDIGTIDIALSWNRRRM